MSRIRDKHGKFITSADFVRDTAARREAARDLHGFNELKTEADYLDEMLYLQQQAGLRPQSENEFFTKDFLDFLGIGDEGTQIHPIIQDVIDRTPAYYNPLEDFMGTASGEDYMAEGGRPPVSHLVALAQQRLGVGWKGCDMVARDAFRNRFTFVEFDNEETVVERSEIFKWMRKSFFWDKITELVKYDRMTGRSHLVAHHPNVKNHEGLGTKAGKVRPDEWEAWSAYYMQPVNTHVSSKYLGYNVREWDFIGGIWGTFVHRSRVYTLMMRPREGDIRGLSILELCWVPLMCYLNTAYYILKDLSQLGTAYFHFVVDRENPTKEEMKKYVTLANEMRANKTIVTGKNVNFLLENAASKISSGIREYLEFLKEDISAAWIIPINQLFGRAQGGGLEGAGALVSKEDYLASNLSTLQMDLTNDIMWILEEMCGFPNLENLTLRWNLDLQKTEEQRLKERMMRLQADMLELQYKEAVKQAKFNEMMRKFQMEEFKRNPQQFLQTTETEAEQSTKPEGTEKQEKQAKKPGEAEAPKTSEKKKKDFVNYMKYCRDFAFPELNVKKF